MNFLTTLSATRIATLIRTNQVSSKEIVIAHLERNHEVNGKLNAVVCMNEDRAIKAAEKADDNRLRGNQSGLLAGLPVTVKDSIDTKDFVTTWGTMGRRDYLPPKDATVVDRLTG